jgi:murein DD-endopeptidase MepM/ murein hydrolase activator NlpD
VRRASRPTPGGRGPVDEHVHVRRGDTLETLLAARGVSVKEARPWLDAAESVYDLRTLRPRRGLTLRFDRETRTLEAIRYEVDRRSLLVLEAVGDRIEARREGLPYVIEVKGVAGRVERGLREDALEAGVPERVVAQLADILGWDLDVDGGLAAGDEFRVLYENLWEVGLGRAEAGNVLGARIASRGRAVTAVYFEDADGRGGYFRPTGESLSRTFLRYPVEFTEITSAFSLLRRHPMLHRDRPHLGVDFAAPRGTPVRAVSAGRVAFSGWGGGLGRYVRIEHADGIVSSYGHLSRVAPGVRVEGTVERGQIIGYVGATGLATGPHLHYEVEADGAHVDPMAISAPPEAPVPAPARRTFERVQAEVTQKLTALPATEQPTTVTLSFLAAPPPDAVATE